MEQSLIILDELISRRRDNKTKRLTKLIANFSIGYAENWQFCVPIFFYETLDIRLTERVIKGEKVKLWTQDSFFNFSIGDIFHNQAYAYCKNFKVDTDNPRKLCLQIESVTPCTPQFLEKLRNPGQVNFKILEFENNWRTIEHRSLSQDDFIRLLIQGLQK